MVRTFPQHAAVWFLPLCCNIYILQIVLDASYVEADCFSQSDPVIVPARTFLSQLL